MKKKLPIGIQSFEKLRTEGYYYVDKTQFIQRMTEEGAYFFLSRPRRFGKSLLVDTLKQAFLGRKDLFQGLYLEKNWDWSKSYPVIHIDFSEGVSENAEHLRKVILSTLLRTASLYGVELTEELLERKLSELVYRLNKKFNCPVVVLIDEYDKPILDRIENREVASELREVLKNLYSVLKPLDALLRFVFITGVTKFSKVSLFSGLNQLNDISLDEKYATLCGYTQFELEEVFAEELKGENLEAIKCWYNGYSFCGEPVYNPFDILLYLDKRQFRAYWFETGTPTFLIKLLFERRFSIPELEKFTVGEELIGAFDVDFIEPENLLFQSGYLTIKDYENTSSGVFYTLTYPNKEVKVSLNRAILSYFTHSTKPAKILNQTYQAFKESNLRKVEEIFKSVFASIPYEWYRRSDIANYEGYYCSVVYSFLVGTGLDVVAEDYTNQGRIDLTLRTEDKVYLIEFKVIESEGEIPKAIDALNGKKYFEKYRGTGKEIYLVGVDFSSKKRNIENFEFRKIQ